MSDLDEITAAAPVTVVWDEALLGYDLGDHPLNPVRLELTISLARRSACSTVANVTVVPPPSAGEEQLALVHDAEYLDVVRMAPTIRSAAGTVSTRRTTRSSRTCTRQSALITGGSVLAAEPVWSAARRCTP